MNIHRLRSVLQLLCLSALFLPILHAQTPDPYTADENRTTDYTLTGSNSLDVGIGNTATQSGILSGDGSANKTGHGTLIFTGTNTYSGGTTISGGYLQIGNGGTSGSFVGNILNNSLLDFNRSDTYDYSGTISGAGSVYQSGPGTLILSGSNSYTGNTIVRNGTLQLGGNSVLGNNSFHVGVDSGATFDLNGYTQSTGGIAGSGSIVIGGSGIFSVGSNDQDNTFDGVISGTGGLTKTGAGILTLSGANTLSGTTYVSGGTLKLGANHVLSDSGTFIVTTGATFNVSSRTDTIGSLAGSGNVTLGSGALTIGANDTSTTFSGVISGTGTVTKSGTGTLSLTGANTYSGATTISAGTLQIGTGGTSGSVAGHITNNATLAFNRSDAATYAGNISGSGSVTKSGADTLTLSGVNTYTGSTTINAGTLQLGTFGSLSDSTAVSVAAGATFDINNRTETIGSLAGDGSAIIGSGTLTTGDDGTSTTFGGVLSGTGNLVKNGAGTFTLTGANTYSGSTTISAGTLQLGSGGTSGSVAGNITNNATLGFNRSDAVTYSGVISGSGSVLKAGADTLTFSGDNTYSGSTTISAGTLQLGTGGTSGSVAGNITNNGTLGFNRSDALTYAGVISGSGSVLKTGADTLTFSGDSTYSGSTTISAGTLQLGTGGTSGSVAGNITNNGTLGFNRSDALTYAGVISGSGSVLKTGAGALTLTGDNTYSGSTTVSAGTLQLGTGGTSGSVAGDIALNANTGVTFQRSNAVTYNGNITYSGTGSGGDQDGAVDVRVAGSSFTLGGAIEAGSFYFNTNGGTLNLSAGSTISTENDIRLGTDTADTTINLADGASFSGSVYIGDISAASNSARTTTLNILANATVDLSDSYVAVGGYGNSGTAELNLGTDATLTMSMVDSYLGGNGHESSAANGSNATVNLSAGSTLHLESTYNMHIGGAASEYGNGGNATINVNDATLTFTDPRFYLGGTGDATYQGGDGTLNLSGSGTTLDLSVNSYLDYQPTQITLGGDEANGGNGILNITNGATLIVNEIYVGNGNGGGSGTLTVSGSGSTLTLSEHTDGGYGDLYIGGSANDSDGINGANGTVTITDQATATVERGIRIGGDGAGGGDGPFGGPSYTGGNGTLTVSNQASLTVQSTLTVGGSPGDATAGNATLNINTGATLTFNDDLYIGGEYEEGDSDPTGNGTLNLGAASLIGSGGEYIVVSPTGTLNVGYDGTAATAAPTLTFDGESVQNYGTINLRHSSGTFTLAAPIEGTGTLNQTGAGSTVLTADNSNYTGETTVSAGTLTVQGAFGSNVTVQNGGTLVLANSSEFSGSLNLQSGAQFDSNGTFTLGDGQTLGGNGTFSSLVVVASGGSLSPGNSPGTLTFTDGLTLSSGTIIEFELGTSSDLILVSGGTLTGPSSGLVTLNLTDSGGFAAGTYTLINYAGATTSSFDLADFTLGSTIAGFNYSLGISGSTLQLTATAVPEPGTYAALAGLLVLGFVAYRKRRR